MKNLAIRSLVFIWALCLTLPLFATDASLLPNGKQVFLDNNGRPLTSGKVYFYTPSTTTFKTTWQNSGKTIANTNPVTLDAAGRAIIYGDGTYRQIVKDSLGNTIWDQLTSSSGSGGGTPTLIGDGNLVGTVLPWSALTAPNQYVFGYGQEIVRATYPEFFTAVTLSQNVNCTSASAILTGLSDTTQIPTGATIEVSCLAPGTTVVSKTTTTITVTNNATITATASAVIFPWGNGNGSTTFNVPDYRGRVMAGRDNMGGTAANRLTSTYYGETAAATGANGGSQSQTLITGNLPAYTPAGTNTISDPGHVHGGFGGGSFVISGGGGQIGTGGTPASTNINTASATTGVTSTFLGTAQGGASTPFATIQPTITINFIVKVTPDTNSSSASGVASLGGMTGVIACGSGITCTGNTISNSLITTVAQYSVAIGTGSGLIGASPGTAGYLLTSNGASANPSFIFPSGGLSITAFGALCDGTTDDGPAIRTAIASTPDGGTLFIPASSLGCIVNRNGTDAYVFQITRPIKIIGNNPLNSVITPISSLPDTVDIFDVSPSIFQNMTGTTFKGFFIGSLIDGTRKGRHGIYLDTRIAGATLPRLVIEDMQIGPNSSSLGHAIHHVNTAINNANGGMYGSVFQRNTLSGGGIYLDGSGDSNYILYNIIGGYGSGVYVNQIPGASKIVINNNNFTAVGGAIIVACGQSVEVQGNNIEIFGVGSGGSNGAVIDFNGSICNLVNSPVANNLIAGAPAYGITSLVRIRNCDRCSMNGNVVGSSSTPIPYLDVDTSSNTIVGYQQFATTSGGTVIGGSATNTIFAPPVLENGRFWVGRTNAAPVSFPGAAAGNVLLSGGVGNDPAWGKVDLTAYVSSILAVPNGGTGVGTLTGLALGNGTSPFSAYSGTSCSAGQYVSALNASGVSTCGTPGGGGGSITLTNTHILVGNASNVATDVALSGDATIANTGAMTLATVNSNVGTFGSATQASQVTINAKGLVTAAANVTVTPAVGSITGLGTGIATALAINVGTAGSPVINGGALGTPSSGTLTSATGLPLSTGVTGRLHYANFVQGATNTVVVNATSGTADFAAFAMPSCSTAASALIWTTNTGFGCNTSITANAIAVGGITGLGTGVATWLATPSSANLATAITDETGSGALVFANTPTLVTPILGVATATSINKVTITAPASAATLTIPDGVTLTGPASSGTAMTLGNAEVVTGAKTFGASGNVGKLIIAGTTSGTTILNASATASGTLTLPAATDTLIGKATTDTLTNKTFDTAGTGNSFSINGVAATANTGTGSVVRATSPTLVTPVLGAATATTINGAAIDNTAWSSYTVNLSCGSGTFTSAAGTGAFKQIGKTVFVRILVTITTNGTCATAINADLPTAPATGIEMSIMGRNAATGVGMSGRIRSETGTITTIRDVTGIYPGADSTTLTMTGLYEAQ